MIIHAVSGFIIAIIVMLLIAIIWQRATEKLERWGYNLTRETNLQLREVDRKLDSILRAQGRLGRAIQTYETPS
jgi:hypothetical protein